MNILNIVILIKLCSSHETLLLYHFTHLMPPCTMTHSIYFNVTNISVIKCSSLCYDNEFGTCGRFVWDPNGRTCFLHSAKVDTAIFSISAEVTLKIYTKFIKGCNDVGYDFDSETNTCLKYHVTGTGDHITWKDAQMRCQQDGGDLISIQTKAKWDFVKNYLGNCFKNFWIGLKGRRWTNGKDFVGYFGVGELLNDYDAGFRNDPETDCGVWHADENYPIQDESCNERKRESFLCELVLPKT